MQPERRGSSRAPASALPCAPARRGPTSPRSRRSSAPCWAPSSIAHTVHGASGMYVPCCWSASASPEQMKAKTVTRPGGYIGGVVASGEAEIAVQQIVELLAVPGIDLVGPLPDEMQKVFETAAGIFTASRQPDAAEELLRFLLAPARRRVPGRRAGTGCGVDTEEDRD